jgi:hypothetical protein
MALNLSTLTNPATSGGILAEALTTADFLDPVPILKNLARGSQKGGDAKQTTGLNQPRALPLIKNPAGNLGGYLYIPNVSGNYAEGPSVTIGSNETWEGELDMVITQWGNYIMPMGGGDWALGFGILFYNNGFVNTLSKAGPVGYGATGITLGTPFNVKYGFNGTDIYADIDGVRKFTETATHTLELNQQTLTNVGNYAIQKAKLTVNSAVVFDCDFNGSTSIRHGDTKFQASVGGPVTINQSGNDPATIIKKSVLRFDGVNDGFKGLFDQTITQGGYMFAAFSVLGAGGETFGRIFGANTTGGFDYHAGSAVFSYRTALDSTLRSYSGGVIKEHLGLWDDNNGDILHESKIINGSQFSKVNNADLGTATLTNALQLDEFNIGTNEDNSRNGGENAAIDLEYLAVFPASITDAEANRVRDFINTRNTVFDLKDGFGYYFYDAQKAPVGAITTGSASWNGRIVGSDNGDSDRYATQGTTNEEPVSDGYVVTFADNADHLEIPSTTQAGWQVVGTSLGTFAYRVDNDAVTELNLLGNLGNVNQRKTGSLYGVILIPESATDKDIEDARKLLIDRGSADASPTTIASAYWAGRTDIIDFRNTDFPNATSLSYAWDGCNNMTQIGTLNAPVATNFNSAFKSCSALTSFPAGAKLGTSAQNVNFTEAWRESGLTSFNTDLPTGTIFQKTWRQSALTSFGSIDLSSGDSFNAAWQLAASLSSFGAIDARNGTNFQEAWRDCSALTDFSADAKLGTSAQNVSFTSAWQQSGLTSFSTPLPTGNVFYAAWRDCSNLVSFTSEINASNVRFSWYGCSSLTSFSTPLSNANRLDYSWRNCTSLTDFSADVFANWNPSSLVSGIFDNTWKNTALTAASAENILVGISNSGKYATTNGASGGSALGNAGIDIDYNTATGSLSAATNTAIDSLSGKGWEVYINGVLVIPNILDLAPAAAYSLRSFDADADPNVVNVRRSSDGATSDFKASEVSDGTLTDWVNTEYETVTNGEFANTEYETVTNGEFATDSVWVKGSGWDIANGKATSDGTQTGTSYLYQLASMGASQSQRVTLVVSGYVAGTVKVRLGDSAPASSVTPDVSSNGTHVFTLPSHSAAPYLFLQASSDFQGSIESISVVQLTADGHVTTWYDQGGTNHASQTLVSNMPKIVDGGTLVTEGGQAALDINKTPFDLGATISFGDLSWFVVTKKADSGQTDSIIFDGGTSSTYGGDDVDSKGNPMLQSGIIREDLGNTSVSGGEVNQHLSYYNRNGSNASGGLNGEIKTEATVTTSAFVLSRFFKYSSASVAYDYVGKAQEIVLFNTDQSANRTGIEKNINDTYTIY